jgi:UDP-glucose 4-epimerase
MKRILVTGANGYLASYLIKLLRSEDAEIIGLEVPGNDYNDFGDYKKIYSDIDRLLKEQDEFDLVYNLAAFIPYGSENVPATKMISSNILPVCKLALHYHNARFILASSVSIYGDPLVLPLRVNSAINNPNLYGLSKLASEAIIKNVRSYGIIRFSSIIGPGMKNISFIPKIIQGAKEKGIIKIYGSGSRKQDYIDVRDAAKLCSILADIEENQVILGVSGRSVSNEEVSQIVAHLTGAEVHYLGTDSSPDFCYDLGDSHSNIDFKTQYCIEDTLQEIIIWKGRY